MTKIGIDLDEILSDTLTSAIDCYKNTHNVSLNRETFTAKDYREIWGKIENFWQSEYFKNTKPVKGAFEELAPLKKLGYEFYIITGRYNKYTTQTKEWLDKYYPNIFSGIYFANTFNTEGGTKKKSEICKNLGIEIFIEDDELHIEDCSDAGIKVLILDHPWNKHKDVKNSIRAYSWKEMSEKINKIKNNI